MLKRHNAKITLVLLVLCMMLSVGLFVSAQQTNVVSSAEGRFTVTIPYGYTVGEKSSQDVDTDVGTIKMTMHMATSSKGACMVAFSDYPYSLFDGKTIDEMMNDARDGALNNINSKMDKETRFDFQGYPARKVYFSSKDNSMFGRFDIIVAKPRLYQVWIMTFNKDDLDSPETDAFFNSFKITSGGTTSTTPSNTTGNVENKEHGFSLNIPGNWNWRDKNFTLGVDGTLYEFDQGTAMSGIMTYAEGNLSTQIYADAFMEGFGGSVNTLKKLAESKLPYDGIRRDYLVDGELYYVAYFFVKNETNYVISFYLPQANWDKYENDIDNVFKSVKFSVSRATPKLGFNPNLGSTTASGEKHWNSDRWGFEITLPGNWSLKIYDKIDDITVAEFENSESDLWGLITLEEAKDMTCAEYINSVIENVSESFKTTTTEKPVGKYEATGGYIADISGTPFQYYLRVVDLGGTKLRFVAYCLKSNYDTHKYNFAKYAKTLKGK